MVCKPASLYQRTAVAAGVIAALAGFEGMLHSTLAQDVANKVRTAESSVYQIPDTRGLKSFAQNRLDIFEDIPGAETVARFYRTNDGSVFASLHVVGPSGKEVTYGYAVNINPTTGIPGAYLINLTGNGQFEVKKPGDSFKAGWVSQHFKRG